MPEIIVKLGDQILQTRRFDGDILRIGRSRENDIVLENLSVSREHATLRFHESQYILTDLNSANGTMVNGVKITKTEVVGDDVITIGKHKLHFKHRAVDEMIHKEVASDALHTVMVEPKADAWITVESGRLKGREFRITRFETSLGKAAGNDIVLTDDWLLGKKQAIILRKGNYAFEIQDLGGLRKVKVNGNAISEKTEIKDNDVVELGGTRLIFHCSAAPITPTGRMPNELSGENVRHAGELGAAVAKSATPVPMDESLDLEEGYHSLRLHIETPSSGAPELGIVSENEETPPSLVPPVIPPPAEPVAASEPVSVEPAAVIVEEHSESAPVDPEPKAKAKAKAEGARNEMFEDARSTSRRRRKHQQRAAKSSSGTTAAAPAPEKKAVVVEEKVVANPTSMTDDAEIKMWEEALQNPSQAIKRQAARTLKKLTGRDYDV